MTFAEKVQAIENAVRNTSLPKIVILLSHLDPDSMASGEGTRENVNFILSKPECQKDVLVAYCGGCDNPQNIAIMDHCDLGEKFVPASAVELWEECFVILVDSSKRKDNRFLGCGLNGELNPNVVIDHHSESDVVEDGENIVIVDIDAGSASTLVSEIADVLGTGLTDETKALLALGIYIDTKKLVDATKRDLVAYTKLVEDKKSGEMFRDLVTFKLPMVYYKMLRTALDASNMKIEGGRLVTNVGYLGSESDSGLIPLVADLIAFMENVTVVVVFGIYGKNKLRISARSNSSINMGSFLKRFGGLAQAGGRVSPHKGPDRIGVGGGMIEMPFEWDPSNPEVQEAGLAYCRAAILGITMKK